MQIESVRTNGRADVLPGILFEMLEILESSSFSFRTYLPFGFAPLSPGTRLRLRATENVALLIQQDCTTAGIRSRVCSPI
jgi:hypothetical protein